MIFHMNQNPYEAEQNDIILSNTVFEVNVAVLTGVEKFDENRKNTVAVSTLNQLKGHGIGSVLAVFYTTGWTKSAFTAERHKFEVSTFGTGIHCPTK